jgi:hypothetical protein
MSVLNQLPKIEQIIGMAVVGTVLSFANVSDVLRVLILVLTATGICIRLYGQYKESPLKKDLSQWIRNRKKDFGSGPSL